jgi:hypothetical protein
VSRVLKQCGFDDPEQFVKDILIPAFKEKGKKVHCHSYGDHIVYDFKTFLERYMYPGLKQFANYWSFLFNLDDNQEPVFWYKADALANAWIGHEGSALVGMN